jgi:rhodanese-related sulfurtransferase
MGNMGFFNNQAPNKPVSLSSEEAYDYLQKGAVMFDIRADYELVYRGFNVPEVYTDKQKIDKTKPVIVADEVGLKSSEIAKSLIESGYADVAYLAGGVVDWDKSDLPLNKNTDYEWYGACACRLKTQKPTI